jgi:hypothetical protein
MFWKHEFFCQICLFSVGQNTQIFELRFCSLVDLKIIYIYNFRLIFLKYLNAVLKKIKKMATMELELHLWFPGDF